MMLCKNCGTQINDQMKFCPECGAPVPEVIREEEIKTESSVLPMCSQCGKQLKPGARFCSACGTKVEESIQNEPDKAENNPAAIENKSEAVNTIEEKTACRKFKIIMPSCSFEISDKIAESAFKGGYEIEIYKNENLIAYMDTKI